MFATQLYRRINDDRRKPLARYGAFEGRASQAACSFATPPVGTRPIPLVADMLEKNHGKPGLRYVDRFDNTLPW
jgi:hypothetical protein